MNIKCCLKPSAVSNSVSFALLLLRLIVGVAFMYHGWGKIQNPMSWMGPAPVPGIIQFLGAFAEFGGGIALILGLLTKLASLGLVITMLVAVYLHAVIKGDPFVSSTGGGSYELALVYLGISILLISIGPGKYSLDKLFFGKGE